MKYAPEVQKNAANIAQNGAVRAAAASVQSACRSAPSELAQDTAAAGPARRRQGSANTAGLRASGTAPSAK